MHAPLESVVADKRESVSKLSTANALSTLVSGMQAASRSTTNRERKFNRKNSNLELSFFILDSIPTLTCHDPRLGAGHSESQLSANILEAYGASPYISPP